MSVVLFKAGWNMAGWLSRQFEKRREKTGSPSKSANVSSDINRLSENAGTAARKEAEQEASQIVKQAKQGAEEIRQRVTVSLRSLIDRAVTDAEQVASGIKAQSRKEAEEEALKIINEAKQKADEIKKQVETINQKEAEEILNGLVSSAPAAGAEARQKLQLYLIKARQEIEKEIRENYEQAQSSVISFLETQEKLAATAVKVETQVQSEPKSTAATEPEVEPVSGVKARKSWFTFSLKGTPQEAETRPTTEERPRKYRFIFSQKGKNKVDESKLAAKSEAVQKIEESRLAKLAEKEAKLAKKDESKIKAEEVKQSKETEKRAAKEAKLLAELAQIKKTNGTGLIKQGETADSRQPGEIEAPTDKTVPKVKTTAAEASEKKPEESIPAEQITPAEKQGKAKVNDLPVQRPPEKKPALVMPVISTERLDTDAILEGEVELAIAVPVDPAAVTKLFNYVQSTSDMKVLYTRGSWDKGTLITVTLDKPMPFLGMISKISGLAVLPGVPTNDYNGRLSSSSLLGTKRTEPLRIDLVLINQTPTH